MKKWEGLIENNDYFKATIQLNDGTTVPGLVICPIGTTELPQTVSGTAVEAGETKIAFSKYVIDQSVIDDGGYLFLPIAGNRNGSAIANTTTWCLYWSTTQYNTSTAWHGNFGGSDVAVGHSQNLYNGCTVRLAY